MMDWVAIGTMALAVIAVLALVVSLLARRDMKAQLRNTQAQLEQTQFELDDRRLDDKVRGAFGGNILQIMNLTDRAAKAVSEAEIRSKEIQQLSDMATEKSLQLSNANDMLSQQFESFSANIESSSREFEELLEARLVEVQQVQAETKQVQVETQRLTAEVRELANQAKTDAIKIGRIRDIVSESEMAVRAREIAHGLLLNFIDIGNIYSHDALMDYAFLISKSYLPGEIPVVIADIRFLTEGNSFSNVANLQ
jgi:hypothetical protein